MKRERPVILIVDDSPVTIQILHEILGKEYEILFARNGREALDVAYSEIPDLILLDILMPNMNGYEVCRHLKEDPTTRSIPVIFITAKDETEDEAKGLEVGAIDYLTKPIVPAIVKMRIHNHLELKKYRDFLEQISTTDSLTLIANRRRFDEVLILEWRRCLRKKSFLSLIMIDVDFFKQYNDRWGHIAGDDCLKKISAVLVQSLKRPSDLVARYGGEEFACILPETDSSGTLHTANRLRLAVEGLQIPHESSSVSPCVTISLGVATLTPLKNQDPSHLIKKADESLYEAKKQGRNRVNSVL